MTEPDWNRLARYAIARRTEIGYAHRRRFAAAVGVSDRTLAKLEGGEQVGESTLATVERGLGWLPGTAHDIATGREPRLATDHTPPPKPIGPAPTAVDDLFEVLVDTTVRSAAPWPVKVLVGNALYDLFKHAKAMEAGRPWPEESSG